MVIRSCLGFGFCWLTLLLVVRFADARQPGPHSADVLGPAPHPVPSPVRCVPPRAAPPGLLPGPPELVPGPPELVPGPPRFVFGPAPRSDGSVPLDPSVDAPPTVLSSDAWREVAGRGVGVSPATAYGPTSPMGPPPLPPEETPSGAGEAEADGSGDNMLPGGLPLVCDEAAWDALPGADCGGPSASPCQCAACAPAASGGYFVMAPCCAPPGCWKANLVGFLAGDGWAHRGDGERANNFGPRAGLNSAWAWDHLPFRVQLGASFGGYDLSGRDDADGAALDSTDMEQQVFVTAGVYRRSHVCSGRRWSGGVVYDSLRAEQWGERAGTIQLGQLRAQLGYAWNERNELGLRGMVELQDDTLRRADGTPLTVGVMDQAHGYWKRTWESGAETSLGFVWAEEPGEWGLTLEGRAPLSSRLALYGHLLYIHPSTSPGDTAPNGVPDSYSEQTWNVSVGIVFYPGWKSYSPNVSGHAGLPLLPVAHNGWLISKLPPGTP